LFNAWDNKAAELEKNAAAANSSKPLLILFILTNRKQERILAGFFWGSLCMRQASRLDPQNCQRHLHSCTVFPPILLNFLAGGLLILEEARQSTGGQN
jgi:hypothetical protein